jgi:hypothetical protein
VLSHVPQNNDFSIRSTLLAGQSVYIIIGGEAESLLSAPGTDRVVVAGPRRKGFVRLALEANAELVPVYMFHNTDTNDTYHAFWGSGRRLGWGREHLAAAAVAPVPVLRLRLLRGGAAGPTGLAGQEWWSHARAAWDPAHGCRGRRRWG